MSIRVDQREGELKLGDGRIQTVDDRFKRVGFEFIISIEEENERCFGLGKTEQACGALATIADLECCHVEVTDDLPRTVGRPIVDYNQFAILAVLIQNALDCPSDERSVIIARDNYGEGRLGRSGFRLLSELRMDLHFGLGHV
jgi:hypothetical protein